MMLPELDAPSLTRAPVTIYGEWLDGPARNFHGRAICAEPIVAVAFSSRPAVSWAKSDRPDADGSLKVRLLLARYNRQNLDVQVNFSIGGGHALARTTLSADAPPSIDAPLSLDTGRVFPFTTVEGSRTVDLYALFLCRNDVRIGRNGLWNLEPQRREHVAEPYLSILTYGRNGELETA
jgi:hypothetical protein